jgi:hypothetical protein
MARSTGDPRTGPIEVVEALGRVASILFADKVVGKFLQVTFRETTKGRWEFASKVVGDWARWRVQQDTSRIGTNETYGNCSENKRSGLHCGWLQCGTEAPFIYFQDDSSIAKYGRGIHALLPNRPSYNCLLLYKGDIMPSSNRRIFPK